MFKKHGKVTSHQPEPHLDIEALRPFTLHVGFLATDQQHARGQARAYVEALNQLRPEVDCYTAEISPGEHTLTSSVFCGSPGPGPAEFCVEVTGHPGDHCWPGHDR